MKRLLALALFTLVAACATAPQTPAQGVYAVQAAYQGALTVAVAYKQLPACGVAATLCSSHAVVKRLQAADNDAYAAVSTAQALLATPGAGANVQTALAAAQAAVSALAAITSTLQVKP